MRASHAILTLLGLTAVGVAVVAYLGARARLPPRLAEAYGTVASLASSATQAFSAAPAATDAPDAGDAGAPPVHRVTQAAPLSSAQLAAPLVHGKFVSDCGAPETMKVVVKVTVKKGRAVTVTVTTDPSNPAVASCVEKATREKLWDVSPKTQHATVTY
jgi:hypothetical protein